MAISWFLSSSGVRQTDSKNGFTSPSRNRVSSFAVWLISSFVIFLCPGRSTSSRSANAAKISSWRPSVIWRRVSAISQSFCLRSGCGVMTRSYVLSADFLIRFVKRASWMEFVGAHACLYRISSADFAICAATSFAFPMPFCSSSAWSAVPYTASDAACAARFTISAFVSSNWSAISDTLEANATTWPKSLIAGCGDSPRTWTHFIRRLPVSFAFSAAARKCPRFLAFFR